MRARGCFSSPRWVVALRGEGGRPCLGPLGIVGGQRTTRSRARTAVPTPETGGEKKQEVTRPSEKKKTSAWAQKKAMPSGMPPHRQQRLHNVCIMSLFYTQAK